MPKQLEKIDSEIALSNGQIAKISADRDNVVYNTNFVLPSQRESLIADTSVKNYQATSLMPAQVANTESDTLAKEYTRMQIMPAQLLFTREQAEAKRAETLNNRTDGVVVAGTIGMNKQLITQQIESFQRDAETKVARMMIDTWITQKGIDDGIVAPAELANPSLNTVIARLKANNGLNN